ncbi:MAG: hypothetical protein WKG07_05465 [Hymenobacter sp.]
MFIGTADFQGRAARHRGGAGRRCDAYVEKPFAETMADNRAALKAIKGSKQIVQIGSQQRRSGSNCQAAEQFIKAGTLGPITMVELTWCREPARPLGGGPTWWRSCVEADVDWKRST